MRGFYKYSYFGTLLLLLAIIPFFNNCKESDTARSKILKIYNWADYIDEGLLTEFPKWYKEQTGEDVQIVYQVFDMTEVMYTKIALGKEDFDLVCPTQAIIERMLKNNMLLPYQRNIGQPQKYFKNISPFIRERLDAFSLQGLKAEDYVIPYMWGTSGILYNKKLVSADEVSSWSCLWNPKNKGEILMKDSYWDAYNIAAIHGCYNDIVTGKRTLYDVANAHTPGDIAIVEEELKKMKPNLAGWEADFGKEMMTKGKIWLSYAWSGDAVWAIDEAATVNVSLGYIVPREGSNIWFDGWVIPKYARNTKAASYFLAYLCRSDVAMRNMTVSGYTSAVAAPEIVKAKIDTSISETANLSYFFGPGNDKLHINSIQYPDSSVVSRCAIINDFLDKNDIVLEMWSRAKGDSLNKVMAIMIFLFFFALAAWLIYRRVKKYQSNRRRLVKKW
jgi:spermidine/putrescine transport system substrate-binding protein